MCVYSMVSDHFMHRWPRPWSPPAPMFPEMPGVPTPQEYEDYQELLRKAKLYDQMTGQPDCPAPEKLEWEKRLREFMEKEFGLKPKGK